MRKNRGRAVRRPKQVAVLPLVSAAWLGGGGWVVCRGHAPSGWSVRTVGPVRAKSFFVVLVGNLNRGGGVICRFFEHRKRKFWMNLQHNQGNAPMETEKALGLVRRNRFEDRAFYGALRKCAGRTGRHTLESVGMPFACRRRRSTPAFSRRHFSAWTPRPFRAAGSSLLPSRHQR